MRALRLPGWREPPRLVDIDQPRPVGHQILIRVEAAGLCHSDLHVIDAGPGDLPFGPPFTLGHEIAGRVAAIGPAAFGPALGDRVVVYGPWGCGLCPRCAAGRENYCDRRAELSWAGAGLGRDGGMAGYVLVPSARYLEPIGDLDATQAAPLSDAGLTPYHAIELSRAALDEGSTIAVIGVGGLGHLAIQLLRALTPATVFAVDLRAEALALAERSGAQRGIPVSPETGRVLRASTGGRGVDVVFDFAGTSETLELAAHCLRAGGELVIVGSGGGRLTVAKSGPLPAGGRVSMPYWGTRPQLSEVIALARSGALHVEVQRFPLSAATEAIALLRAGKLTGRAVLIPDSA